MPQLNPADYPQALNPTEEESEEFETVYGYIDSSNMLSNIYEVDMHYVDNIIEWLKKERTTYLKNNPDRIEFLREYLIRDINNRNVEKRKYESTHLPTAVINSDSYITSIDYPDTTQCNIYEIETSHFEQNETYTTYSPWVTIPDNREQNPRNTVSFIV